MPLRLQQPIGNKQHNTQEQTAIWVVAMQAHKAPPEPLLTQADCCECTVVQGCTGGAIHCTYIAKLFIRGGIRIVKHLCG